MKPLPFPIFPVAEVWYPAATRESARESVFRCLDCGEGIAAIFGKNGVGKTLLLRVLEQQGGTSDIVLLTSGKIKTVKAFYQQILLKLQQTWCGCDEDELRLVTMNFLEKMQDQRVILLLDDAQNISFSVLDEIRALFDIGDSQARMRVAIAGTFKLEERLTSSHFNGINQRIACRVYLEPFDTVETAEYIEVTSSKIDDLRPRVHFTSGAKRLVHCLTEGVPRLVNQVCNQAIFLADQSKVTENNAQQTTKVKTETGLKITLEEKLIARAWSLLQQLPESTIWGMVPSNLSGDNRNERSEQSSNMVQLSNIALPILMADDSPCVFDLNGSSKDNNEIIEFGELCDEEEESHPPFTDQRIQIHFQDDEPEENDEPIDDESEGAKSPSGLTNNEHKSNDFSEGSLNDLARQTEMRLEEDQEKEVSYKSAEALEDRYLEELRQLQDEVSLEANLIRQLRDIHLRIRRSHTSAYLRCIQGSLREEQEKPLNDSASLSNDISPSAIGPNSDRHFESIFRQIYAKEDE